MFPLDLNATPEAVDSFDVLGNLELRVVDEWEVVDELKTNGNNFYAMTDETLPDVGST